MIPVPVSRVASRRGERQYWYKVLRAGSASDLDARAHLNREPKSRSWPSSWQTMLSISSGRLGCDIRPVAAMVALLGARGDRVKASFAHYGVDEYAMMLNRGKPMFDSDAEDTA